MLPSMASRSRSTRLVPVVMEVAADVAVEDMAEAVVAEDMEVEAMAAAVAVVDMEVISSGINFLVFFTHKRHPGSCGRKEFIWDRYRILFKLSETRDQNLESTRFKLGSNL